MSNFLNFAHHHSVKGNFSPTFNVSATKSFGNSSIEHWRPRRRADRVDSKFTHVVQSFDRTSWRASHGGCRCSAAGSCGADDARLGAISKRGEVDSRGELREMPRRGKK